jgi:hypothetical protein
MIGGRLVSILIMAALMVGAMGTARAAPSHDIPPLAGAVSKMGDAALPKIPRLSADEVRLIAQRDPTILADLSRNTHPSPPAALPKIPRLSADEVRLIAQRDPTILADLSRNTHP